MGRRDNLDVGSLSSRFADRVRGEEGDMTATRGCVRVPSSGPTPDSVRLEFLESICVEAARQQVCIDLGLLIETTYPIGSFDNNAAAVEHQRSEVDDRRSLSLVFPPRRSARGGWTQCDSTE